MVYYVVIVFAFHLHSFTALSSEDERTADPWIQTAAEVLEHLPNGVTHLPPLDDYKAALHSADFKLTLYK